MTGVNIQAWPDQVSKTYQKLNIGHWQSLESENESYFLIYKSEY